ncbi:MAG: type II secretion system protein [Gammaproteobacteria bacterium]|nr:type II secretion system protein [Gammaproteobacteria bacterium]
MLVNNRVSGFTLLEAIVALVLLTTAGLALFSWINASFDALNRIETNNARAAAEINALEYLKTVNPYDRPEGEEKLGEVTMRWRARAVTDIKPNITDALTPGSFVVALYDVEVTLESPPTLARYRFNVRQMGYKRVVIDEDETGSRIKPPPNPPAKK